MPKSDVALLFCHGLESAPIGRKSQALIDAGYRVTAPDCRGKGLAERVEIIVEALRGCGAGIVVGSSFGGIAGLLAVKAAAQVDAPVDALVLCAPALQVPIPPGLPQELAPPCPTTVVHGTADDVIPIEVSRRFAREHGVTLHEVDDDHRLASAGLAKLLDVVERCGDRTLSSTTV